MDALGRKTCGAMRTVKPCGPVPPMQGTSLGLKSPGGRWQKSWFAGEITEQP